MLHAVWEFEKNTDPVIAGMIVFIFACGLLGGWAICQVTHKQRGVEVDRPVTDVPPPPVVIPDTVPEEWVEEEENA